jgi:hypothetical protein
MPRSWASQFLAASFPLPSKLRHAADQPIRHPIALERDAQPPGLVRSCSADTRTRSSGPPVRSGTTTVDDGALLAAVQSGQASLALVDEAVLRILTTMFRQRARFTVSSP